MREKWFWGCLVGVKSWKEFGGIYSGILKSFFSNLERKYRYCQVTFLPPFYSLHWTTDLSLSIFSLVLCPILSSFYDCSFPIIMFSLFLTPINFFFSFNVVTFFFLVCLFFLLFWSVQYPSHLCALFCPIVLWKNIINIIIKKKKIVIGIVF